MFFCQDDMARQITYGVQRNYCQRPGLAMWRYSVLRKPGLMLIKDMKMKIYSIDRLYS